MTDRHYVEAHVCFTPGLDDLVQITESGATQDSDVLYAALAILKTAAMHGNNDFVKAFAQRIYNAAMAEHDRNQA